MSYSVTILLNSKTSDLKHISNLNKCYHLNHEIDIIHLIIYLFAAKREMSRQRLLSIYLLWLYHMLLQLDCLWVQPQPLIYNGFLYGKKIHKQHQHPPPCPHAPLWKLNSAFLEFICRGLHQGTVVMPLP